VCEIEQPQKWVRFILHGMKLTLFFLLVSAVFPLLSNAQAPVFEFTKVESTMKFDVKASVAIVGKFDKWDTTLTFTSPEMSLASAVPVQAHA
jgi:hypothetical protein